MSDSHSIHRSRMNPPPISPATPRRTGLPIASLVLGILALPASLLVIGALFGICGLILGVVHLRRGHGGNGLAWTGIILSSVAMLMGISIGLLGLSYFRSPEFQEKWKEITQRAAPQTDKEQFAEWLGLAAPNFSVTTLDGKTIQLSDLKGKHVVLDFWATWCPPCVMEIPHFIQLRKETPETELVIVGISSEDKDTLKSFVTKKGINYPIASADDLPSPYKDVSAIPTTFFIDRQGIIQHVLVGYHDLDELKKQALAADVVNTKDQLPNPR